MRWGKSNFEGLLGFAFNKTLFGRDFKSRRFGLFRLKRCEVELVRILLLVKALVLVNGDLEDILVLILDFSPIEDPPVYCQLDKASLLNFEYFR